MQIQLKQKRTKRNTSSFEIVFFHRCHTFDWLYYMSPENKTKKQTQKKGKKIIANLS